MNKKTFRKIAVSLFALFSLGLIVIEVLFIISQMINIKYYFENCLPYNKDDYLLPICTKEYIYELISYAKIIIGYAICGLILSICIIVKK